jgi:hypothetical protein
MKKVLFVWVVLSMIGFARTASAQFYAVACVSSSPSGLVQYKIVVRGAESVEGGYWVGCTIYGAHGEQRWLEARTVNDGTPWEGTLCENLKSIDRIDISVWRRNQRNDSKTIYDACQESKNYTFGGGLLSGNPIRTISAEIQAGCD